VQGFHIARPMEPQLLQRWLAEHGAGKGTRPSARGSGYGSAGTS